MVLGGQKTYVFLQLKKSRQFYNFDKNPVALQALHLNDSESFGFSKEFRAESIEGYWKK